VRRAQADDQPRVLALLQAAFGGWPRRLSGVAADDFFRWKHVAARFGPSVGLVAEVDGAIVGFLALMTWRLRIGGQTLRTNRSVDLAVEPAWQRRGVSMALIHASRSYLAPDVAFSWSNPNDLSRGGARKAGRRELDGMSRFVALGGSFRSSIRRASSRGSSRPAPPPVSAAVAAELLDDGTAVSRLLGACSEPGERYVTAKDVGFLRWRYACFEEYRAVALRDDAGLSGLAIFRLHRHDRVWIAQVSELLIRHNDLRAARRLIREVKASSSADLLTCAFASARDAARCGFLKSPHGTMTANPMREKLVPDPALAASWALSMGDLELL
jgi:GNAT superfamily N-acetyltransferase